MKGPDEFLARHRPHGRPGLTLWSQPWFWAALSLCIAGWAVLAYVVWRVVA